MDRVERQQFVAFLISNTVSPSTAEAYASYVAAACDDGVPLGDVAAFQAHLSPRGPSTVKMRTSAWRQYHVFKGASHSTFSTSPLKKRAASAFEEYVQNAMKPAEWRPLMAALARVGLNLDEITVPAVKAWLEQANPAIEARGHIQRAMNVWLRWKRSLGEFLDADPFKPLDFVTSMPLDAAVHIALQRREDWTGRQMDMLTWSTIRWKERHIRLNPLNPYVYATTAFPERALAKLRDWYPDGKPPPTVHVLSPDRMTPPPRWFLRALVNEGRVYWHEGIKGSLPRWPLPAAPVKEEPMGLDEGPPPAAAPPSKTPPEEKSSTLLEDIGYWAEPSEHTPVVKDLTWDQWAALGKMLPPEEPPKGSG